MEERAGNYKEYPNHFNLSETHLRKIHSVMEDYANKIDSGAYVSIYIERENNSFYETRDLEKIVSEENSSGKSIETLRMEIVLDKVEGDHISSEKDASKAMIGFSKSKDVKIKLMTANKSRDWCFLLIDELDTQVQRIIKGKSTSVFKARILDLVVALSVLIVLLSGIAWNTLTSQYDTQNLLASTLDNKVDFLVGEAVERHNTKTIWFIPGMAMVMIFFLVVLEFKPITKLVKASNTSVFYWGDMIPIYDAYVQKRTRIKWGVVIAFVVSLAASLITALVI